MNKPFYLEMPLEYAKLHECFPIDRKHIGIGNSGINLVLREAQKQGVYFEYIEFPDRVDFYVAHKARSYENTNIKEFAEELFIDIEAAHPAETMGYDLRKHYPKVSYSKFKKAIAHLLTEGRIVEEKIKGQKGRPAIVYKLK